MNPPPGKKELITGILLAVLTTIIWSGNYVVARGISTELPPVSLAFFRWSVASIGLTPLALKPFMEEVKTAWNHKWFLLFTALNGVTIFNTLIYLAGHYTTAINLALIGTTAAPLFVILLSALFFKENIAFLRLCGMATCLAGILLLLSHGNWEELRSFHFGKGDLLMLVSAFSFAVYTLLVRRKPAGISALPFLWIIFVVGTICLLPFYLYESIHNPVIHWSPRLFYIILYLGVGNSIIAFLCWNASIRRLGPSGTSIFGNLIPIFSSIEAVLILGEHFTFIHLISGLLVVGGLVIANLTRSSKKP
jgi:drug/metabolite transporter (DMT)-like permease